MIGYIFSSSFRELMRPRRVAPWILAIVLIAMIGAFTATQMRGTPIRDAYGSISSLFIFRLVALMSSVFSVAVVAQEVEQKTIVYLLTRPVDRRTMLIGRALASAATVGALSSLAVIVFRLLVMRNSPQLWSGVGAELLAVNLGAFAYAGLFVFISLLANKATTICLLYAFGFETFTGVTPGSLQYGSIFAHMNGIAQHPSLSSGGVLSGLSGQSNNNPILPGVAIPVLLIVGAAGLSIAAYWFYVFEFLPREDAE
ncbi:MAG: ABC transporter permease subunit [Chthonomonas sp.]|nr:ABC transporter permease subunit [Chthonomonas sp.]